MLCVLMLLRDDHFWFDSVFIKKITKLKFFKTQTGLIWFFKIKTGFFSFLGQKQVWLDFFRFMFGSVFFVLVFSKF